MKNRKGDAMLVVVCALAVIMMLCLSVLLAVSTSVASADSIVGEEQSRVWAVSFSKELERMLTAPTAAEESDGSSLCNYIQKNICKASWPYYNEDERGHSGVITTLNGSKAENAYRTFTLSGAGEELDCQVTLYWEADEELLAAINGTDPEACAEAKGDIVLVAEVSCTAGGRTSTVRNEFTPGVGIDESSADWNWGLSWRE